LPDPEVVDEADSSLVEVTEQLLGRDGLSAERPGMEMRIDDGGVRLFGAIETGSTGVGLRE
jgi:hypothetical protein